MTNPQVPLPDPANAPSIPPRVRSWVYMIGLGLAGVSTTAIMITAVVAPDRALLVAGIAGAVLSGFGWVSNGLGVAFRPSSLSGR